MAKANSSSRFVVVTLALAIAGYGLYLLNKYLKNLQKPADTPSVQDTNFDPYGGGYSNTTSTSTKSTTTSTGVDTNKVLTVGSKGTEVKQFQSILNQIANKLKDSTISVDGDFGKKTDALYQKLSLNATLFKSTISDANRYLTTLSGGNVDISTETKFNLSPLDYATTLKTAINVSWYQSKCAKSMSMCDTLKTIYSQGTPFYLQWDANTVNAMIIN